MSFVKNHIGYFAVLLILLSACRTEDALTKALDEEKGGPEWVIQRPIDNSYYIGIGSCNKKNYPADFNAVAKKNALSDMASSVCVRVQGESFLNTLEVNKVFSEDFSSKINTTTDVVFDDFETVATYDNGKEYWIYLRVSKYDYQKQQEQKKQAVLDKAFDFYQRGLAAQAKMQVMQFTDMWLNGLFVMKAYWSENNPYILPSGEQIILDQAIYNALQKNLSDIQLQCDENNILLLAKDHFARSVSIGCTIEGKKALNVPVRYHYPTERYTKMKKIISDNNGNAIIDIQGIPLDAKQPQLEVGVDLDALIPSNVNETIAKGLLKNAVNQNIRIPITLVKPTFYIVSVEKEFDNITTQRLLAGTVEAFLAQSGFKILKLYDQNKADFIIEIQANTIDGGYSNEFASVIMDLKLTLKEYETDQIKYQNNTNSIKGVQLNTSAASNEAYKKAKTKLDEEWLKAMIQSIL
jgi:hypothetical protein